VATDRETALRNAHLLYGCTGRGAITEDDYELLPDGAILANAASGNHELGKFDFVDTTAEHGHARGEFRGKQIDLGEAQSPMRHGVARTKSGKEFLVMRSGYVCNMGRDIPPEIVQLIRGLLLGSVLQAVDETESKLIDVNEDLQAFLIDRINNVLAQYWTSLLTPDFRKLPDA
jgi:hypothetical protein